MIAIPRPKKPGLTRKHQEQFVSMLPTITRVARQSFSDYDAEAKEEATAEVIAAAFMMFVRLVEQGREALAFPTVLAMYGIKRVKIGRMAATPMNCKDVASTYCQLQKNVTMERLDRYDREDGSWQEVLVEDRRSGPDQIAAARIDIGEWMKSLPSRTRKIAKTLAKGESTGKAAKRFGVSAGRISQMRKELAESWGEFQGEAVPAMA